MSDKELQTGDPKTFLGELEEMDLTELKDKQFMVAINSGKRESHLFIQSTIRGPYDFTEMVAEASRVWKEEQIHPTVIITEKDRNTQLKWLDECTIDFIEARSEEILVAEWLDGTFDEKTYTCKAGILEADNEQATEQDASS